MTTRQAVVTEALTWVLTPYHHRARVKGAGVDCANMPAAVYEKVGLIPHINPEYSPQWYMHRDEEIFLKYVTPYSREITESELDIGDFVLFKFGRTYSHGSIYVGNNEIVHAYQPCGMVVLGDIKRDADLNSRDRRFFTMW